MGDKKKQSLYFPEDMLNEIQAEAQRQDRSLSWIVQQAWKIAHPAIYKFPSMVEIEPMPTTSEAAKFAAGKFDSDKK
jgi:uncharacterized small protein (TIGR04563 family)